MGKKAGYRPPPKEWDSSQKTPHPRKKRMIILDWFAGSAREGGLPPMNFMPPMVEAVKMVRTSAVVNEKKRP